MCELFTHKVRYLSYIFEPGRFSIEEDILKARKEAEKPRTKEELCNFLVICNAYWRLVCGYTTISAPLNQVLKYE